MDIFAIIFLIFQIYIIFTILVLLLDNREPAETFAWIFIFLLVPGIGLVIYMIIGRGGQKAYNRKNKQPQLIAKSIVTLFKPLNDIQEETIKLLKSPTSVYQDDLMTLLYQNSHSLITTHNETKIFHNGKDKFDSLYEDIKKAKKFIHLEYFIWRSHDPVGRKMKELLLEKVKEGVEIRILYDYSGCFFTLGRGYIQSLRKAGIQIYPFFNYLSKLRMHTLNHRNHRKIVVIDGKVGYTGGMNIGQEYIDGGKKYASWRDSHLKLEGESVSILEAIFAIDWYNTVSQEDIFDPKYYPLIPERAKPDGKLPMQLPTSGFDSPWPSILHLYFAMITEAQKNIYIVSPYFIPEASLLMALKTAAMRGIKVVVLMTGVPDNPIPYWAAFSYFEEVLKSGVKIFQYQKGFMHAKIFSSDGKISSIGTANFDIRSLKLNYEINAVFYNQELTKQIDAQIAEDLTACKEITLADLNQKSILFRLRNSFVRLIANLL